MSTFHAVVWLDHTTAHVLQFDPAHVESQTVKARSQHTRAHANATHGHKTEREYYDHVAQALAGVQEVLVVGPGQARTEFVAHCEAHRKDLAARIVGTESADHPTDNQLVALARRYFEKYDRMAGTPSPMA